MSEPELEFENAFEFAGYYLPVAFNALLKKQPNVSQIGFYGGDAEKVANLNLAGLDYDAILTIILKNEAQCLSACLISDDTPPTDWGYPKVLLAEAFEFATGTTGTVAVPYTPGKLFSPLKIHTPQTLGIQTGGVVNTNHVFDMVACFSLLQGVQKNPLYKETFTGRYEGQYLPEAFIKE